MPLKILLLEDEEPLATSLANFIRDAWGYDVRLARKSQEAYRILKEEKPRLMLLDLYLDNDVSGLTVLREARAQVPDIIVYVLTGFNDEDLKRKSLELGARDYFVKPLNNNLLKAKLEEAAAEIEGKQG